MQPVPERSAIRRCSHAEIIRNDSVSSANFREYRAHAHDVTSATRYSGLRNGGCGFNTSPLFCCSQQGVPGGLVELPISFQLELRGGRPQRTTHRP